MEGQNGQGDLFHRQNCIFPCFSLFLAKFLPILLFCPSIGQMIRAMPRQFANGTSGRLGIGIGHRKDCVAPPCPCVCWACQNTSPGNASAGQLAIATVMASFSLLLAAQSFGHFSSLGHSLHWQAISIIGLDDAHLTFPACCWKAHQPVGLQSATPIICRHNGQVLQLRVKSNQIHEKFIWHPKSLKHHNWPLLKKLLFPIDLQNSHRIKKHVNYKLPQCSNLMRTGTLKRSAVTRKCCRHTDRNIQMRRRRRMTSQEAASMTTTSPWIRHNVSEWKEEE